MPNKIFLVLLDSWLVYASMYMDIITLIQAPLKYDSYILLESDCNIEKGDSTFVNRLAGLLLSILKIISFLFI
jgi:hypothetical protein